MSTLHDRIQQFRKMATDDPENELGHFRLGQLLMEDQKFEDAIASFKRTLELSPQFSKVYQLLGECHVKRTENDLAIAILTKGYHIADERGDKMPRDAMALQLAKLGSPIQKSASAPTGPETGYRCQRPGCLSGKYAKPLEKQPIDGSDGAKIKELICEECWTSWIKDFSIKVVNELRLDLSSEFGQSEYDRQMRSFFGFE